MPPFCLCEEPLGISAGRDVAIARYAFRPSSNPSLKFQNRVLIVCPMSFRTSGRGSAVRARRKLSGFVFRRYFFYGQTFTAQLPRRLLLCSAKVTKGAPVIANASLPAGLYPCKIKQNPRLQIFVPGYPVTLLTCNGQIFDAFVALPSPVLFYFHPRLLR